MAVWRHEAGKLAPRLGRKTVRIGIGHKLTRKEREGGEEGEGGGGGGGGTLTGQRTIGVPVVYRAFFGEL